MKKRHSLSLTLSILIMCIIWHVTSISINEPFILPDPLTVFFDALLLFTDPLFFMEAWATCIRSLLAFVISVSLSLILGIPSGLDTRIEYALKPPLALIKATPVVSFILIALLWFGSSIVPIFVSVLMTLPIMTEAILKGMKQTNPQLLQMATSFRFSRYKTLIHIRIPSIIPFFLSGSGSALGLTWKVVVAGEILAMPRFGLGQAMQTAKIHLETTRVFSLTLLAIFLSICTDLLFHALVSFSLRHQKEKGVSDAY